MLQSMTRHEGSGTTQFEQNQTNERMTRLSSAFKNFLVPESEHIFFLAVQELSFTLLKGINFLLFVGMWKFA